MIFRMTLVVLSKQKVPIRMATIPTFVEDFPTSILLFIVFFRGHGILHSAGLSSASPFPNPSTTIQKIHRGDPISNKLVSSVLLDSGAARTQFITNRKIQ